MTLTEVLMALMVMAIGVVSVFTLFPISLLRSIEATKITNATLLKQNSKARIEASVSTANGGGVITAAILNDPDADGNVADHEGEGYIFDPLGAWIMSRGGTAGPPLPTLPVPPDPPFEPFANATAFGDIAAPPGTINNLDLFFDTDGNGTPDRVIKRYSFGIGNDAFGSVIAAGGTVPEAVTAAIEKAEKFVTLPDSFNTLFDGLQGTGPGTFTTNGPPVTQIFINDDTLAEYVGTQVRVTAFNAGKGTSAVIYDSVATPTPTTPELATKLPASVGTPTRLIVDVPERRYTWIATVRNIGTTPSVAIAVFFRRSFSPADERVYNLVEPVGSYNVFQMKVSRNQPPISSTGITGSWTGLPPGFESGGWMLDLNTFRWWKIVDIQERDTDGDGTNDAFLFSTDPAETYDTDNPGSLDPMPPGRNVRAIFPQNIIEVYTLSSED